MLVREAPKGSGLPNLYARLTHPLLEGIPRRKDDYVFVYFTDTRRRRQRKRLEIEEQLKCPQGSLQDMDDQSKTLRPADMKILTSIGLLLN